MAGRGGNCRKKGGLVAGQGRAPNRVPAGLQAVASLREVIFFVQPGAVVKKIPIFAAQIAFEPRRNHPEKGALESNPGSLFVFPPASSFAGFGVLRTFS